jgi:transglutaminase-like putative cysteine protease
MATTQAPPRHQRVSKSPPGGQMWALPVTPIAAGFAVLCASTALSGVLQGTLWVFYLPIAITLVVGVGMLLRSLHTMPTLVALAQMFALLCLLTMSFTSSGILLVLPGPAALSDLVGVLQKSVVDVRTEVPPVAPDTPILCLVLVSVGLVAVTVDMLAVEAEAPAASGLVLLCVYAVPASLADEMLPWWSFVLGASAFAALLAVDGRQKHRAWRGRRSGLPGYGQGTPSHEATGIVAVSIVLAMIVGATFTVIGTVGRLPDGANGTGSGDGTLGVKPFTKLSGLLRNQSNQPMFQVSGMPQDAYLQLVTLDQYVDNDGWQVGAQINGGASLTGPSLGTGAGPTQRVTIEPVNWLDRFAPLYGVAFAVSGLGTNWHYDTTTATLNTSTDQNPGSYVEQAMMMQPTSQQLRDEGVLTLDDTDKRYQQKVTVSTRVLELIAQVTRGQATTFDKVAALTRYLNDGENGFTYTLDAVRKDTSIPRLDDFLFNTKSGYCEQYASALGAMLRSMNIPTRLAIGFTPGVVSAQDSTRTITGADAHAWVEVDFPDYGWVNFDPTPAGERVVVPPYMSDTTQSGSNSTQSTTGVHTTTPTTGAVKSSASTPSSSATAPGAQQSDPLNPAAPPVWAFLLALLLAVALTVLAFFVVRGRLGRVHVPRGLALALAIAGWALVVVLAVAYVSWWLAGLVLIAGLVATPAVMREYRRRSRLGRVAALGSDAPSAAWDELLAEAVDRGAATIPTETVRATGRRLVREHDLDETGREALRLVITAVEGAWYGERPHPDPSLVRAMTELRASLHRAAPLAWRAKVLPRSVLPSR